jgi:hypothetical protein
MSTLREAAQQALEAPGCERLREWVSIGPVQRAAVESFLQAALAQEGQAEPVAEVVAEVGDLVIQVRERVMKRYGNRDALYTHPPRRDWQSLSEEEIRAAAYGRDLNYLDGDYERYARAIEQALRSKNHE